MCNATTYCRTPQALAYTGCITVHWTKVNQAALQSLDMDRNSKLDGKDLHLLGQKVTAIISQGVPSAGGFMSGLALGMKML